MWAELDRWEATFVTPAPVSRCARVENAAIVIADTLVFFCLASAPLFYVALFAAYCAVALDLIG